MISRPAPQTAKTPARRSSRRPASAAPRTPDLIEGEPCPKDGCTLYWPRWHDGQPKCKLCALDESLAAMAAQGCLTHRPRKGKTYTPPRAAQPLEERPVWWDEEET
jgi:hypothetical protein